MSQNTPTRLVIIGGGPGGYIAAVRAAQLGAQVTLIEKDRLGGTCLNKGCIPTKAISESALIYEQVQNSEKFGISINDASYDLKKIMGRKQEIVDTLVDGIAHLMKKHKVKVVNGTGAFLEAGKIQVTHKSGDISEIEYNKAIIATGSRTAYLPEHMAPRDLVISSDEALELTEVPKRVVIIGAGAIGMEFAGIFNRLGAEVSVIEMLPQILPLEDNEIARRLEVIIRRSGIKCYTKSPVEKVSKDGEEIVVTFTRRDKQEELRTDIVLLAVGRIPFSDGLNLDNIGVETDRSRIIVNDNMLTNVPGVYAIGDVTGGILLAHVASEEGVVAAEHAMGIDSRIEYDVVPACTYTHPEVGSVGLKENEVKEKKIKYKVGKFRFGANGRALILGEPDGIVKTIVEEDTGKILGVHILGPRATELVGEVALAMRLGASADDIAKTIHAHPTVYESLKESSLSALGKALHG